ncbi:hypothetical protein [Kineosporia sp. NBRC 101731]|uniref:hypothetical protein n=1 Tax=Kineosporia sp. NBRC 101731 TaxID=3032199 RepID=UPI0024A38BEF|nr:hypothetical protein [Kineosporia sp. NBRC 101731]GLY32542.1 hypothetical protein Kisp02_59070 [Kineosporia sp. NBRC 101731]
MLSALRDAAEQDPGSDWEPVFITLGAAEAKLLSKRLDTPVRSPGDWSIALRSGCTCDLCQTLTAFLASPQQQTKDWPLAKNSRSHIHSRIDSAELPVTHVTRRQGRPFVLVLTKTRALFTRDEQQRARDQDDLEWLTAQGMAG